MTSFYDEIEIEDFELIDDIYYFPCPCGDKFQISIEQLQQGEEIAHCPSCSLIIRYFNFIRVIYDQDEFVIEEDIEEDILT
jgi:diphthamide biosynthesis protein 3